MSILNLAYVGLGISDIDNWAAFAQDILGLEEVPSDSTGNRHFRMDAQAWRLGLFPAADDDIIFAGYSVADRETLQELAKKLSDKGVDWAPMNGENLRQRHVSEGIRTKDPQGLDIEIIYGPERGETDFVSPRQANFVTGELGLGHIVLYTSDLKASMSFYNILGFQVSDYIEFDLAGTKVEVTFLHCNKRHHTLALVPVPVPQKLNHLMLEVTSVDQVITAYYRARQAKLSMTRHLGRHTNDRMLSFYVKTPAGFDIEYGCDGIQIGDDWQIKKFDATSLWGHDS